MIKRSTWLLLLLLLAAIGVFIYLKNRPAAPATPTPTVPVTQYLFSDTKATLTGVTISDKKMSIVAMERPAGGLWTVRLPAAGPADQALAEAAATQVTALAIKDTLQTTPSLDAIGLLFPEYTMEFTFQDGTTHELEIGVKSPTGNGYYVRLDNGPIYIVSADGIDALLTLLKTPPFLPPTGTPVPTPATVTPTP